MPEENPQTESDSLQRGVRNQFDIDVIMCLRKAVRQTFFTMCKLELTEKPKIELKQVIRWQGKLRIIKPLNFAFVSVILFKNSHTHLKKYEANGIIVLYIPSATADELLISMGFGSGCEEDDIKDACGEFLNVMAGRFKTELVNIGYEEVDITPPFNFGLKVDELFDYYQDYKFEVTFFKNEEVFFQLDIGLDKVTKKE